MSTVTLRDSVHNIEALDSDLAHSRFEDVRLAGSSFSEVTFADSRFASVLFDGCSFQRASFVDVHITESNYESMTIEGIEVNALLSAYRAQHANGAAGRP